MVKYIIGYYYIARDVSRRIEEYRNAKQRM